MAKMRWLVVPAAMLLLFSGGNARAGIRPSTVTFSPFVGKYLFEGNEGLKDRGVYGLGLGYNFDENWAGEAVFRYVDTQDTAGSEKSVEVWSGQVDLHYHFLPGQLFVPYLAGGVGAIQIKPGSDSDEDLMVNYGAGFKYFFADNTALRGDARHILDFASGSDRSRDLYHNLALTVGLFMQFGDGRSEAPALSIPPEPAAPVAAPAPAPAAPTAALPVVADGDGDGVEDGRDKCPNTPAGMAVNAYGCPRDSDGDGVFDIDDRCPGTPAGVAVGADGCPVAAPKAAAPSAPPSLTLQLEFASGQSAILAEFETELQRAADFIRSYPESRVRIEGHTDSVGSDAVNQRLSAERADSVRRHLAERYGVAGGRIEARGFGETRPVASNATPEGRRQNRRVVVTVVP
jgi:OOP family OmpA-OmpF porin